MLTHLNREGRALVGVQVQAVQVEGEVGVGHDGELTMQGADRVAHGIARHEERETIVRQ